MLNRLIVNSFITIALTVFSGHSLAIPALQLGSGSDPDWNYVDETWVLNNLGGGLNAYANATASLGGNGQYAWDDAGAASRYAYLVVSAIPASESVDGDVFEIIVENDGGSLSIFSSGWGIPPIEDTNDITPHGIFPTYFEIYQFQFDGSIGDITDQQPGETGTGKGYAELFDITVNSLGVDILGLHFDLFTVIGDGTYTQGMNPDKNLVNSVAPFSHDATMMVPEPAPLALLGIGLLALVVTSRRQLGRN